ncbi:hypothetical protein [Mucilaginibacter sp. UR6-11]|uniref:hypothetical protein n=1 Tax=Mucilaginibacter sp. UR6-11 TaxID=1435644 RepID=UPI001E293C0D|nr:hypothetical protein [Mucilaginibacter sp. UR6-11]MCC8424099.1 hypothetical protein [Mucilaginibacter sp. UR6-11]
MLLFSITWGSVSGWWAPVCLLLGLLYAWVMYRRPLNLADKFRYALAAFRTLAVFLIALLLVSPLVRSTSYQPQKPLILVAQDNSASINTFHPAGFNPAQFVTDLGKLKQQLGDGYEVQEFNFGHELSAGLSQTLNGRQTNIAAALRQLNDRFANQNIGAVVLATDGLYNQGADPQYEARNFKSSIYTIALGDTVARRDLLIGNVNYNKTAFLGNDFEIEVLAQAYQSKGETMYLTVTEDGRQVSAQLIPVTNDAFKKVVTIKLNADKKGIHKFNIGIRPVKNELSTQNNVETIYVEVLDAKQKILLVYDAAHPDINVIKQAIEANKNYELKTSLLSDAGTLKLGDYSLVIVHQPSPGTFGTLKELIAGSKTPLWYMLGAQADASGFNAAQKLIKISASRLEMQEVFAQPASGFTSFTLSDSTLQKISGMPPLQAPFGSYTSSVNNGVLFKQKIGSVATSYPLLLFGDDGGRRLAILTGEGLWRWQLAEYQNYGNHHAMEELFSQSVQYLTANGNRQRFRAYPSKNIFDEGENVLLNAELYNEALELVNTPDVKVELKNADGKNYSFLATRNGQSYQLDAGALPVGAYTYTATTKLGNRLFNAGGQLTVKPLNLEIRQSAANHQLLRNLARQSGGEMLQPSQISRLADLIRKNENIKTLVYEDKHYSDMIDVKWIFVLIVALLSVEWFLRKREGEI